MAKNITFAQSEHLIQKSKTTKKLLGQYFTHKITAEYMSTMIRPANASVVRILDAGAGAGILTTFAAIQCLKLGHKRVHAVLYEIDEDIFSKLKINMEHLTYVFKKQGCKFTFKIHNEDFVLTRPDKTEEGFHISSINPPYFKYNSKTSPYAKATTDLYNGNPNIYASFMAIVSSCLAPNGQMVAIVPRSFTNGLYFKGFRQYMNRTMSLNKIHIFKSRNQVFEGSSVLQENIICYYTKHKQQTHIDICTSIGCKDLGQTEQNRYLAKQIIDKSTQYEIIRIPEALEEAKILNIVEKWPTNFQENGYFISTGPVVEYRAKKYITNSKENKYSIPLLKMHNIKAFQTRWTGDHKKDAYFTLIDGCKKYVSKNQLYVILKRFSAKDEKRRLVAAVHNPQTIQSPLLAMENHINYIGRKNGLLNLFEAYGLATLFNSTLMDKYFRCLSGNTQVNATEIKLLKMPSIDIIQQIGELFLQNMETSQNKIDSIINFYLEETITL